MDVYKIEQKLFLPAFNIPARGRKLSVRTGRVQFRTGAAAGTIGYYCRMRDSVGERFL